MSKDYETTSGLTPGQLARLWALGTGSRPAGPRTEADFLARLLAQPAGNSTVGPALADPAADAQVIDGVRRDAKTLARRSANPAERAAATAVYYAAIAHALAFGGRLISRHSRQQLGKSLADLEARPWMPANLRQLFARARTAK